MINTLILVISLIIGFHWWWIPRLLKLTGNSPEEEELRVRYLKEIEALQKSNARLAELSLSRRDEINKLVNRISPGRLYQDGGVTADEDQALRFQHKRGTK